MKNPTQGLWKRSENISNTMGDVKFHGESKNQLYFDTRPRYHCQIRDFMNLKMYHFVRKNIQNPSKTTHPAI